jgi:phenylalanyl-tRNA synthetase alpha chain
MSKKKGELLTDLKIEFDKAISEYTSQIKTLEEKKEISQNIKKLQSKFLGKESKLLEILGSIKDIENKDEKKEIGKKSNELRVEFEEKIEEYKQESTKEFLKQSLEKEIIDPTRPGEKPFVAHKHIISTTVEKIEDIFTNMGFGIEYSLEVDNAQNAFDFVNIPEDHPARDNWDTLWLEDGNLAIPHTSAMQNRIMSSNDVPIKKAIIGKCFRNEATDARHEHTFMQLEGVYLNKTASLSEMLGVLLEFFESFFDKKLKFKFTPDYFPFVEPGGQMAIECVLCDGKGCRVCKGSGFLEVLGCGMIHPNVIKMAGKDPKEYKGFAWGVGIERLVLINYQVNDIRYFYSGDLRFVEQFY